MVTTLCDVTDLGGTPQSIAFDEAAGPRGVIYFTDTANHCIRAIHPPPAIAPHDGSSSSTGAAAAPLAPTTTVVAKVPPPVC